MKFRLLIACSFFLGYSGFLFAEASVEPVKTTLRYVYFEAEGAASPEIENQTQQKAISKNAAVTEVLARIALYVDSQKVPGYQVLVKDRVQGDENLQHQLDVFIQGAEVTDTQWSPDGTCRVEARIRRSFLKKLLNSLK